MTPEEIEKEFKEWWYRQDGDSSFLSPYYWAKLGYLEAHSRQEKEIKILEKEIDRLQEVFQILNESNKQHEKRIERLMDKLKHFITLDELQKLLEEKDG